jgi:hypothetical protein
MMIIPCSHPCGTCRRVTPGIAAFPTIRSHRECTYAPTTILRDDHHAASRSPTTAAIPSDIRRSSTVCIDRSGSGDGPCPHKGDPTASRPAAGRLGTPITSIILVILSTCPTTATQDQARGSARKGRTTEAAVDDLSIPSPTAYAAKTTVATTAATAVIVIIRRVAIRASAATVAVRATPIAPRRIPFQPGIRNCPTDIDIPRCACVTFPF